MTRRRAVLVALLALAVALAARGEGGAADSARATCLRNARTTRNTCMREAAERCGRTFDDELQGCFGPGNTCVRGCIAGRERCLGEPQSAGEGCRIACGADQKVALQTCKTAVVLRGCQDTAKRKARACKQECAAKLGPSKQRCGESFNDCLAVCAGG